MTYWQTIHTEERDGFKIVLSVAPETEEPDWDFETEDDRLDTLERINDGRLSYFMAHVAAIKNHLELAHDYLGGCCYQSTDEFINEPDGYFQDMVSTVIREAKDNIKQLCEAA